MCFIIMMILECHVNWQITIFCEFYLLTGLENANKRKTIFLKSNIIPFIIYSTQSSLSRTIFLLYTFCILWLKFTFFIRSVQGVWITWTHWKCGKLRLLPPMLPHSKIPDLNRIAQELNPLGPYHRKLCRILRRYRQERGTC